MRTSGIEDPALRAFVATNYSLSKSNILQWKINLDSIYSQIPVLAGFDLVGEYKYHGETFLINGGASRFVRHAHMSTIGEYFPNHMLTTIRGVGQAPDDTLALLKRYLDRWLIE